MATDGFKDRYCPSESCVAATRAQALLEMKAVWPTSLSCCGFWFRVPMIMLVDETQIMCLGAREVGKGVCCERGL